MRKVVLAEGILLCVVLSMYTFAQTSNATLGGTVSDTTGALIPGVTITATNTQTGILSTSLTNEAGAYQFASLQTGIYRVAADLNGFQTQAYNNVTLGVSQQVRLNFTLQVSSVAQAVEVTVAADTLIATTSSSVGTVLPEYKVRDLPLVGRNVFDLVNTTAGTQRSGNFDGVFAGGRITQVNTTRDSISVGDGRYDNGAFSTTYVSPDLVEEVRIIVAPADAESGRGSGQVQMATRAGTNQFRGSVFWTNRNSALDANSWFNNFNGNKKDYRNRNQFGGRLGGPIIRNKTFFFFLYEGQRFVLREYFTGNVLTAQSRQGIFRFFPGVENGNAISNGPTVDLLGNPVRPAAATGELQSFSVFGRDPFRPGYDPSKYTQELLSRMPLPNDFTVGDGLNTAGHRWVRRIDGVDMSNGNGTDVNRDQYNFRIDHNVNANHKIFFSGTHERTRSQDNYPEWPNGFTGFNNRKPDVYTASLVSTLSPTIVSEFRAGRRRGRQRADTAMVNNDGSISSLLPVSNGLPFLPIPVLFAANFFTYSSSTTRGATNPLHQFSETLSWTHGQHAFKGGFEARFTNSNGFNNSDAVPSANFGPGAVSVTGIDSATIPGLIGTNQTTARNLLIDLAGSVGSIREAFQISGATNPVFKDWRELKVKQRDWHENEWSAFFKDDWKVRPDLTINLGLRYEYYGVPYETRGLAAAAVGGSGALFGISGTGFADQWQPGRLNGALTSVEFVGKNSPNPGRKLYKDDWNNFGPAAGFSWSLPWWGKDKTVLRAGTGISYQGAARYFQGVDGAVGNLPGVQASPSFVPSTYLSLSTVVLPIPGAGVPLQPVALTDRTQNMQGFDDNRVNPYIQNWNLEFQRELVPNLTFEARYVASKGTKLWGGIPLNDANIFENGILEAFNVTRAGGDAPLFDRMLRGLNLGLGQVNGTTVTGSASLRQNTLFRAFIANGSVGQFANLLNTTTTVTGQGGGLLRNGGLPENFIVVNPQFSGVTLNSNPSNSTYHSMQLQVTKRLSHGFTNQTSYTWSRALGENDNDGAVNYLNPRNRSLQKTLLSYHRTHTLLSNGTFELPFGPRRRFLSQAPGVVERLVERWQFGAIFSLNSGQPLTVTASTSSFTQRTNGTPNIVGEFPKETGSVTRVGNGVIYFKDIQQITDPTRATVTTLQGTQSSFSSRAIADAGGRVLLVNPVPGELGTLGQRWIEGPGSVGLDVNLIKRVRMDETKEFEFRLDAINLLNRPNFGNPILDINSTSFGRITSASGNRSFVVNARVNF